MSFNKSLSDFSNFHKTFFIGTLPPWGNLLRKIKKVHLLMKELYAHVYVCVAGLTACLACQLREFEYFKEQLQ